MKPMLIASAALLAVCLQTPLQAQDSFDEYVVPNSPASPVLPEPGTQPAPPPAPEARPVTTFEQLVISVEQANDPSVAVDAYARALAVDSRSAKLHRAYVRRMVDFGIPQLAYLQAQLLVNLDRNDGLGWTVMAYSAADKGDLNDALDDILVAARHSPDDPFTGRTAAQLVAYNDFSNRPELAETVRAKFGEVRRQFAQREGFGDEYGEALSALRLETGAPAVGRGPTTAPSIDDRPSRPAAPPPPATRPVD